MLTPNRSSIERKDRTRMPLQQTADRRERAVDVVLRRADRCGGAVRPVAPDGEPFRSDLQSGPLSEVVVDHHHRIGLDRELRARREREQIVDRHHVLGIAVRLRTRYDQRSGARAGRDEVVVTQPAQCLANGVAADLEPLAQLLFGRQLGADGIHPVDDLLAQGACHLQVPVVGRRNCHVRRSARTLPSPSADTYRVPSGPR